MVLQGWTAGFCIFRDTSDVVPVHSFRSTLVTLYTQRDPKDTPLKTPPASAGPCWPWGRCRIKSKTVPKQKNPAKTPTLMAVKAKQNQQSQKINLQNILSTPLANYMRWWCLCVADVSNPNGEPTRCVDKRCGRILYLASGYQCGNGNDAQMHGRK